MNTIMLSCNLEGALNNKVSSSLFYIYARKKKSSAALNIIMKTLFSQILIFSLLIKDILFLMKYSL